MTGPGGLLRGCVMLDVPESCSRLTKPLPEIWGSSAASACGLVSRAARRVASASRSWGSFCSARWYTARRSAAGAEAALTLNAIRVSNRFMGYPIVGRRGYIVLYITISPKESRVPSPGSILWDPWVQVFRPGQYPADQVVHRNKAVG